MSVFLRMNWRAGVCAVSGNHIPKNKRTHFPCIIVECTPAFANDFVEDEAHYSTLNGCET